MESVPRDCVTPAPVIARSDLTEASAATVVLRPKEAPRAVPNSRVPPPKMSVPAPRAAVDVPRNVPLESVTAPVKPELSPERINLPLPDFVKPLEPVHLTESVDV